MKKIFMVASMALSCFFAIAQEQGDKIGILNNDGNFEFTVSSGEAKSILKKHSLPSEAMPFEATDISITQMESGAYSLTGYFKNPGGHIVKGFRIQCSQDDANNLIVEEGNKKERVTGKPF